MKLTPIRLAILVIALLALVLLWQRPRETRIGGVACSSDRADALSVLFIGNSHTFTNDLPKMLCRLASPERPLRVSSVVAPGWSLSMHWDDGRALRAIREQGPFSYVVLQEHSGTPLAQPDVFAENVRKFDAEVRAAGAKSVLFELWPRRDIEQDPGALQHQYAALARKEGLLRAPVGPAWLTALGRYPKLQLYQPDGLHAEPAGTYLAACVFFAALLNETPEHRPVLADLDAQVALDLQKIAWQSLRQ